jgi:hypothetical protein
MQSNKINKKIICINIYIYISILKSHTKKKASKPLGEWRGTNFFKYIFIVKNYNNISRYLYVHVHLYYYQYILLYNNHLL